MMGMVVYITIAQHSITHAKYLLDFKQGPVPVVMFPKPTYYPNERK